MHYDGNYRDTTPPLAFRLVEAPSRLLRWTLVPVLRRIGTGSKILYYHESTEAQFRSHVRYLKSNYNLISLDELIERTYQEDIVNKNDVAIVFDDGRRTLYSDVNPVVQEFDIPVTVYLVTDAVETGVFFWDRVNALQTLDASPGTVQQLARLPPNERRQILEESLSNHEVAFERTALTWQEIREMQTGPVDFQCHTVTHPSLPAMSQETIESEILNAAARIENEIGTEVRHFSYPLGHCSEQVVEMLRKEGFESAVGVTHGANTEETDPYQLRRIGVETASTHLLSSLMEGIWGRIVPGKEFRI